MSGELDIAQPQSPTLPGRIIAFGDIHGCARALDVLLHRLEFRIGDTCVILGDIIDRGPRADRVIARLLELKGTCPVVFIQGNHEEMYLEARRSLTAYRTWLAAGGLAVLESYGGNLKNIPAEHHRFLEESLPAWETDREIFVHAGVDPLAPLAQQTAENLRWNKFRKDRPPHISGKRVLCGHTPQKSHLPLVTPGYVCLDTWAYGGGWLTALDVNRNHVFQGTEDGRYRDFPLMG